MRWAADDELYGILHLDYPITPDDAAGRLFIRNTNAVWLQSSDAEQTLSKQVYEAPVEKVENESLVLKLPSKICTDFKLYDTSDSQVEAQFQLNRVPLCQMHAAIDSLGPGQLGLLYPEPAVCQSTRPEVSSGTTPEALKHTATFLCSNKTCKNMKMFSNNVNTTIRKYSSRAFI